MALDRVNKQRRHGTVFGRSDEIVRSKSDKNINYVLIGLLSGNYGSADRARRYFRRKTKCSRTAKLNQSGHLSGKAVYGCVVSRFE